MGRNTSAVRPILKWAGGKRQLLPALRTFYPAAFNQYIEPFVGSGAVFLDLYNRGLLAGHQVRLSDVNADLIGCYRAVRDAVDGVIDALQQLEAGHAAGGHEHFYDVRNQRFNPARRDVHAGDRAADRYTPELAAMLIYLNRAGFNGLFRVNSRGEFNVPAGRHASLRICDGDNLRRLATALRTPHLSLEVGPFDDALARGRGRAISCTSIRRTRRSAGRRTSRRTRPRGSGRRSRRRCSARSSISRPGAAHVLLSNSVAPDISALYEDNVEARGAGLTACRVEARRAINSSASRRGPVPEYLITNVPRGTAGRP